MWWLDPGKELLQAIFNRVMAPYLENLDMNQVNYGISSGSLTLRNLRLKREALDKFRLPVDVIEGNLGTLKLVIPWRNFNNPLEATIEDLFLLVKPAAASKYNPEDEEKRQQASKQERLRAAETVQTRAETDVSSQDEMKNQSFIDTIIAKIMNNFQVTVRNIHVRYEDSLSCPGHPFAAGLTLSNFTVVSVNGEWQPAFVPTTAGAINKLVNLESLAIYFNTDSESIEGLPVKEGVEKFRSLISTTQHPVPGHQFVLKPISGVGKITMNRTPDNKTPKFDVQLLFEEIGFSLDDHQYRDIISMVDMYHFFLRHQQYRRIRPSDEEIAKNKARAMLKFAGQAILDQVHDRRKKWTWKHFQERRDDRKRYVELYRKKLPGTLGGPELGEFDALERKLPYEDLQFYRSISRSELRKDLASRRKLEEEKRKNQAQSGWFGRIWGSGTQTQQEEILGVQMNDERRKELYDALDYDERAAVVASLEPTKDSLKVRAVAKLNKGSLTLFVDPHGHKKEVVGMVFEKLCADVIQRPTNLEACVTLGDLHVHDGVTEGTLYHDIVRIKRDPSQPGSPANDATTVIATGPVPTGVDHAFLMVKFERNPLDERADNALTVRLGSMEVIYHKGYVEAVYNFFKPPETHMESINALMDVASETLEGFRNQTRAGLEHALQAHKTIDVKMDIQAPVVIVPENVRSKKGIHLVIDAGHLAIESNLVEKSQVREIYGKRNQQYTDEDYKRLENLMYDRYSLKLQAAQFLIGNDLDSCMAALTSETERGYHLLERTSIDFSIQNSILPSALQLARLRVSGNLPELKVNLSNIKYKALMRLIDIAIPKLGEPEPEPKKIPKRPELQGLRLSSNVFAQSSHEYTVDEEGPEDSEDGQVEHGGKDEFHDATEGTPMRLDLKQHQFELHFVVDRLQASLFKAGLDGIERPLAEVVLQRFNLDFALAKFNMQVDLTLGSIAMNYLEAGRTPTAFISSEDSKDENLLKVKYVRAQQDSPEFMTTFDGIDQSVDVAMSTLVLRAQPEPVIAIYDFLMTTFVPQKQPTLPTPTLEKGLQVAPQQQQASTEKIRVRVKLESVQVILLNASRAIATLNLSTADVALLIRGDTLLVVARLGNLTFADNSDAQFKHPALKEILSIEGSNFADFSYETFDPTEETFPGINSKVVLHAGSIKLNFLEQPLHDLYEFLLKLAKLKGLYDAAAEVAVQSASGIQRMQFDISVKTPIVVFPTEPSTTEDALVLKLGEIIAKNQYQGDECKIQASLRGIRLTSHTYPDGQLNRLKMIDDVEITANVTQTSNIDHVAKPTFPEIQVAINLSDIKLSLTQNQFCDLVALSQAITRIATAYADVELPSSQGPTLIPTPPQPLGALNAAPTPLPPADLGPELNVHSAPGTITYPTIDLELKVNIVKLQLYDGKATSESKLDSCGIARFALNDNVVRFKMLSSGAGEAEVILKSFTVKNTRPGNTKFREIIPAGKHDRNQFMVLFTMSGGAENSSLAVVTIDSPKVIFTLDPIFALLDFFMSAFPPSRPTVEDEDDQGARTTAVATTKSKSASIQDTAQPPNFAFRVDMHDVAVTVLESDADANSQAISLGIQQILMSQQGIVALTITRLGMSLTQMGNLDESVRFLDDVDMTLSLDSRQTAAQQMTSIDIASTPIVFRASQRDINLIMAIVTKAAQMAAKPVPPEPRPVIKSGKSVGKITSAKTKRGEITKEQPRLVISKEKLKAGLDGFRFVLIGEAHEQPMLHLKTKPFMVDIKDWSADMRASTSIAFGVNYWNLTNSHWEPVIEPWTVSADVTNTQTGGLVANITSHERLEVNVSTTLVETALAAAAAWNQENLRPFKLARGGVAPYRIRNQTGVDMQLWSSHDGKQVNVMTLNNSQETDWRFDDWKSLREHVSTTGHNTIGVKFEGKPWEQIGNIAVDKEGQYSYILRPRLDKILHRMLCDIVVENNVKIVTLRSTYNVFNDCLYSMELVLVDTNNKPVQPVQRIAPKQSYSLPIEAVTSTRIKLRPDAGFGFGWSTESLRWEDLFAHPDRTVSCRAADEGAAPFRLNVWADYDRKDNVVRSYPKLTVRMQPPLELENLLPFDIKYRVHDKNTGTSASEFLRKGGLFPVHSVQLDHLVLLNIALQDTAAFKLSHFMIISTDNPSEFPTDDKIIVPDLHDRPLELRLNYVRDRKGSSVKVQIYSPFIIINKTGLPFSIRSTTRMSINPRDVAGDTRQDELSRPTPFLLSHANERGHEFVLKVGDSDWSEVLDVEAPTAETDLMIPRRNAELHLGVSWTPGSGNYKLTKIITLAPRFIIKNNSETPICYRELGGVLPDPSEISPGTNIPIHWTRRGPDKLLKFKYPGLNGEWSAPINMEDIGSVHFRVQPIDAPPSDVHLWRADVEVEGATIFIILNRESNNWPYKLVNESDYDFIVLQTQQTEDPEMGTPDKSPRYKLSAHTMIKYAWDNPTAKDRRLMLCVNAHSRKLNISEVGNLQPFKFLLSDKSSRAVSLDIKADGSTQILTISNYQEQYSMYKPVRRPTGRQDTLMSQEAFEAIEQDATPTLTVSLSLEGIGLSLINRSIIEVVYLSARGLKVEYMNSDVSQSIDLSIGHLQIDNQLPEATFNVVFQPTPISRQGVPKLPTVHASVIILNDRSYGVLFIKYASVLLQALTIQLDEDFLMEVIDLTKIKGAWKEQSADILLKDPVAIPEPKGIKGAGQEIYFEGLFLQPIRLHISFVRAERTTQSRRTEDRNPLATFVHAFTMAVGNIDHAPLEFKALILQDVRLTQTVLIDRMFTHYRQAVLLQLYRILGSIDFIGNPVGLFTNVSSGVMDIFYEPYQGVVMHGNRELGSGIAKGAASFIKKTTFGLTDSLTKFTSSVGKGLSSATFDAEYQERRRLAQRRNKPRHAFYGFASGAGALLDSLGSAGQGVIAQPVAGFRDEGGFGFLKGIGKGLAGAVIKPAVGVADFASNVTEGFRNTTTMFDPPTQDRVRQPRHVPFDGVLGTYFAREAIGQTWMREVDRGHFKRDLYVAHIEIQGSDNVILLTTSHIISFYSVKLRLDWSLKLSQLAGVTAEDTGIVFADRAGSAYNRFIYIPENQTRAWFFGHIEKVVKAYNANKQLDA